MTTSEVAKIMDTVMCIPGMNDAVKLTLSISRKNILLLNSVIERGLEAKEGEASGLLDTISKDSLEELKNFSNECLQKAGLIEVKEKLKAFTKK